VDRWFAVARSEEVRQGHVFQSALFGQEMAVWRAQSGGVNAWENRCPHRGVRLSIGEQIGDELRCRYHGWRFATGTGQCTYMPAHPTQKPGAALCATVYRSSERYGYVWASLQPREDAPLLPLPEPGTTLRGVYVDAPAEAVGERLLLGYGLDGERRLCVRRLDPYLLISEPRSVRSTGDASADAMQAATSEEEEEAAAPVLFLLQPLDSRATVIHACIAAAISAAERLAVLRAHNARLLAIRDAVEQAP
jgi:nitrite reductase/ring-hydroxylating ferredoxin subunit